MEEMVSRVDLLMTAMYCGGVYAAFRVFLTVFYPFLSGAAWQSALGPIVVKHWPSLGQCEDESRPSYLPTTADHPLVMTFGLFPIPIDDVTQGIRDGLLLGVFVALLPGAVVPLLLTMLLAFVIGKHTWRLSKAKGAAATDLAFWAVREILMYAGAILALQSAHLFR